jgi:hypothetical protein
LEGELEAVLALTAPPASLTSAGPSDAISGETAADSSPFASCSDDALVAHVTDIRAALAATEGYAELRESADGPLARVTARLETLQTELGCRRTQREREAAAKVASEAEAESKRRAQLEQQQREQAEAALRLKVSGVEHEGGAGKLGFSRSGANTPLNDRASASGGGDVSPGVSAGDSWTPEEALLIRRRVVTEASSRSAQNGDSAHKRSSLSLQLRITTVDGCRSAPQSPVGADRDAAGVSAALQADIDQPSSAHLLMGGRAPLRNKLSPSDLWRGLKQNRQVGSASFLRDVGDLKLGRSTVGLGVVAQRYRRALQRIRNQDVLVERLQDRVDALVHDGEQVRNLYRSLNQSLFDKVVSNTVSHRISLHCLTGLAAFALL